MIHSEPFHGLRVQEFKSYSVHTPQQSLLSKTWSKTFSARVVICNCGLTENSILTSPLQRRTRPTTTYSVSSNSTFRVTTRHRSEETGHAQGLSSPGKGWLALVSWLSVSVHDLQLVWRKALEKEKGRCQTAGHVRRSSQGLQHCCSCNHPKHPPDGCSTALLVLSDALQQLFCSRKAEESKMRRRGVKLKGVDAAALTNSWKIPHTGMAPGTELDMDVLPLQNQQCVTGNSLNSSSRTPHLDGNSPPQIFLQTGAN